MSKHSRSHLFEAIVALIGISLVTFGTAAHGDLVIGSPNTATADPSVPRPNTRPCVVQLFTNFRFDDFSPRLFQYAPPPGCPGPWSKVVFEGDFSVTQGRQFDRTANVWIGGTNIYFGTTSEPSRTVARSWHVERDLTDYSALLTIAHPGEIVLFNLVNQTYTGVLFGSADLQFYPLEDRDEAPITADLVLPLSAGPIGGTVSLQTSASTLASSFNLPRNIERAVLDIYAQSQANDEFWYTCVPDDVADELQSCGATAFREGEVTVDGQPAGVAPIYPWIFTGGIDPFLWRPIPSVQTLNFVPYRVDLTPFAGLLSNGQTHEIALRVHNANHRFEATASLLIFLDHGSTRVTGGLTRNTIGPGPTPDVQENLIRTPDRISGTVTVSSSRLFSVEGFVNTSHGRVRTEIEQEINFSNRQEFDITALVYVQNIAQTTSISTLTTTRGDGDDDDRGGHRTESKQFEWPLTVDFSFITNPDNSGSQSTSIHQEYNSRERVSGGEREFFREISNAVSPADTLLFDAHGAVTGNEGQQNAQRYFSRDSNDFCYSRSIAAADGVLTLIQDGQGCERRERCEDGERCGDD
jgi:hypothetical protein